MLSFLEITRQDGNKKYEEPTIRLDTVKVPDIYDTSRMPFNGLIGNGSILRAKAFIKSYEFMGKKGLKAYINKGIVLSLNDFNSAADDDDLWEDVKVAPLQEGQGAVPGASVDVATASEAFATEEDDDLPF